MGYNAVADNTGLSLIVTLDVSLLPFFRDIDVLKLQNCSFFLPLPRLTPPLGENPLEFLDQTYPQGDGDGATRCCVVKIA